jgi:hypothetical protein
MLYQHSQAAGRDVTAGKPGALGFGASADLLRAHIQILELQISKLISDRDWTRLSLVSMVLVDLEQECARLEAGSGK